MLYAGCVAELLAKFTDLTRKGDGAVLAAGAAHRDHQLALALLHVERQRVFEHILIAVQQLLRLLGGHDVVNDLLIQTGLVLELRHIEGVRQAAHIEHEICLLRQTVLKAEGYDHQLHRAFALVQEQAAHPLPVLRRREQRRVNDIFCLIAQRLQKAAFPRDGLGDGNFLGGGQRVLTARLLVAALNGCIVGIQEKNIVVDLLFIKVGQRLLQLFNAAHTAHVHDDGNAVQLVFALQGENQLNRVAVVMDVRGVRSIEKLQEALADLDEKKIDYDILFLDANDAAIQRRYKETRRQHPLAAAEKIPITEAIARERRLLQPLRDKAKYVIDTSLLSAAQNRERVCSLFLDKGESPMELMVVSFGFKYGLPQEADLVLDVRCLPNPFYVPELKHKTGLDQEVVDYVMASEESQELLHRYEYMLEYALPLYVKEGKSQLMIAVGCTGGKHRSITFARKIGEFCKKLGYAPSVQHRDVNRSL